MHRLLLCVSILLTIILSVDSLKSPIAKDKKDNLSAYPKNGVSYRLPNSSIPLTYEIAINWTDEITFKFYGNTKIKIVILEHTETIVIHKRYIQIENILVKSLDVDEKYVPISWTYSNITDFLTISFDKYYDIGSRFLLDISYQGRVLPEDFGFFFDSYPNETGGKRRILAATKFKPTFARHAFPCYDEPRIKANFSLSITHKSKYTASSNMPAIETIHLPHEKITTKFQTTPPMSSYLVAFAISDFEMLEGKSNSSDDFSKTLVRVFSQPKKIADFKLVLNSTIKLISEIGRYIGIPYTLDKMDQIAIPTFGAATENWGLIVYGEKWSFWKNNSQFKLREEILLQVGHAIAHQWFGNLVSPDWWEYIWLNEGFADYFGYKGADLIDPSMGMMDIFLVNNVQNILGIEGYNNLRPMSQYVEDPRSVSGLFDRIAYTKSGSVIRMFSHAFGEKTFLKGVNKYIKSRSFSIATEEHLFHSISEAVKEDNANFSQNVGDIMRSWTRQSGYPLLNVTRDYKTGQIVLTQERYFNEWIYEKSKSLWRIPYNIITSNTSTENANETIAEYWLGTEKEIIYQTKSLKWNSNDWVFFNKHATGYYRVMYDENNYKLLAKALKNGQANNIDSFGRSQLINDAFDYAQNGQLKFELLLNLLQFMKDEITYAPWFNTMQILSYLNPNLAGTEQYPLFEKFQRNMIDKLYKTIGITDIQNEPHLNKYLRIIAILLACSKGHSLCRKETTETLKKNLDEGIEFHHYYQSAMNCESMRGAKSSEYNRIWMRLADPSNKDYIYRVKLINMLACVDSISFLKSYLNSALNSTNDKFIIYYNREQYYIINAIRQSGSTGLELTIDFLIENIDEAVDKYGKYGVFDILFRMSFDINNKSIQRKFGKLIKVIVSKGYFSESDFESSFDVIKDNFKWQAKHLKGINAWLKANV